jgi:hypothetical protein
LVGRHRRILIGRQPGIRDVPKEFVSQAKNLMLELEDLLGEGGFRETTHSASSSSLARANASSA